MKIKTTRFGDITVDDDKVLHFPEGVIGFQGLKRFVLIGKKEKMVMWLQAADQPEVAFIVVNPYLFEPNYSPKFTKEDLDFLKIKDKSDINVLAIVVVPENPKEMTANLLGPIVVNNRTKIGKQVILTEGNYSVKHSVVKEAGKVSSSPNEQMVS